MGGVAGGLIVELRGWCLSQDQEGKRTNVTLCGSGSDEGLRVQKARG
jgi:hypothetical protein